MALTSDTFAHPVVVWLVRIGYATVILGVGLWLAFFISGLTRRQAMKNPRIDTTLGNFFADLVRYALIAFVVVAVLQMFGVQTASLIAVLGGLALALGLALQGTLGNVASGIILAMTRPYHIGDHVNLNGQQGLVEEIDLFFTRVEALSGHRVLVPNGVALANPIVNLTRKGRAICELSFGVGYDDDLDKVFDVLKGVLKTHPRIIEPQTVWTGVTRLGDFAVDVTTRFSVEPKDFRDVQAEVIKVVKEAFDREGIDLPYPHAVEMSKGEIERRAPPVKPKPDTLVSHATKRTPPLR